MPTSTNGPNGSTTPTSDEPGPIVSTVLAHARDRSDAPALLAPGSPGLGYHDLARALERLADALRAHGVRRTDRVAVLCTGELEEAVALLAVCDVAVCCPLDRDADPGDLAAAFRSLEVDLVVAPEGDAADRAGSACVPGTPVLRLRRSPTGPEIEGAVGSRTPTRCRSAGEELLRFVLRTSGTTAAHKLVGLTDEHLLAGARASVAAYGLGPGDRRLNVMPFFHVQGFVGSLLTSLVAGASIVCRGAFDVAAVLEDLRDRGVTWFSATPAMHRALLERLDGLGPVTGLRFVRCGSGHLDPTLRGRMEAAWQVPVVESYGMSEAHQIASTPIAGDSRAVGMRPTGSQVWVLGPDGRPTRAPHVRGELLVRGSNVIDRYLWAPPEDVARAFVDGALATGDLGEWHDDGSFSVIGRLKDVIDRAGEKVAPRRVDEAVGSHPAVREAAAFGVWDPAIGSETVAVAVVLRDAAVPDRALLEHARARLEAHEVPERVLRLAALPLGRTGKVQRSALGPLLGAAPSPPVGNDTCSPTEREVLAIWLRVLQRGDFGLEEQFFDVGGDSLRAATLLARIEDRFAVRLSPLDLIGESGTVRDMAAVVGRRGGEGA